MTEARSCRRRRGPFRDRWIAPFRSLHLPSEAIEVEGNGHSASQAYGYDSQTRITSVDQKMSDGTVISSESHVYDRAGNIKDASGL